MPLTNQAILNKRKKDEEEKKKLASKGARRSESHKETVNTAKQVANKIKTDTEKKTGWSNKNSTYSPQDKGKTLPTKADSSPNKGRGITQSEINKGKTGAKKWYDSINESTRSKTAPANKISKPSAEATTKQSGHQSQSNLNKSNAKVNERRMTPEVANEVAWQWSTNPVPKFMGNAVLSTVDNTPVGLVNSLATGNSFRQKTIDSAPYGQEFGSGKSAGIGNFVGTMAGYGMTSGVAMGTKTAQEAQQAILNGTKLGQTIRNSSIVGKIGQFANKNVEAIAQDRVRDALSNIAIGAPMNFANNYAQGLRGEDLARQMAWDTAADFAFDTGFNVGGDVLGAIGKQIQIKKLGNIDFKKKLNKSNTKEEYLDNLYDSIEKLAKGEGDASADLTQAKISAVEKYAREVDAVEKMTDAQFNNYKQGLDLDAKTPEEPINYTVKRGRSQPKVTVGKSKSTIEASDTYNTTNTINNDHNWDDDVRDAFENQNKDFESIYENSSENLRQDTNQFKPNLAGENEIIDAIDKIQMQRIHSGKAVIKDSDELADAVMELVGKDVDVSDVMRAQQKLTGVTAKERAKIDEELEPDRKRVETIEAEKKAVEDELQKNQQYEISKLSDVKKEIGESFPDATKEEQEAFETAMRNEDVNAYREAEKAYNNRLESEKQAQADKHNASTKNNNNSEKIESESSTKQAEEKPSDNINTWLKENELPRGNGRRITLEEEISDYDAEVKLARARDKIEEPNLKKKASKAKANKESKPELVQKESPSKPLTSAEGTVKPPKSAGKERLTSIAKENEIYVPSQVTIKKKGGKGGADNSAKRSSSTNAQIREAIERNFKEAERDRNLYEYQNLLNDEESTVKDILDKYIADRKSAGSPIGNAELSDLKKLDKDALYNAIEERTLKINGVKTFDDLADLMSIEKRGWSGETSASKAVKYDGAKGTTVTPSDVATVKMGESISVPVGDAVEDLGDISKLNAGDYLVHKSHGVMQFKGIEKDKALAKSFGVDKDTDFFVATQGNGQEIKIAVDKAGNVFKKYAGEDTPELGKMFDSSDVAHSMNSGVEDELTKVAFDKYGTETSSLDTGSTNNGKRLPKKLEKGRARKQFNEYKEWQAEGRYSKKGELPKGEKVNAESTKEGLGRKNGKASYSNKTNYTAEEIASMHGKTQVEYDKDVMKGWQTYSNSDITPEEARKMMEEQADKHLKKYISNKSIIENAEKKAADDFDGLSSTFFGNAKSGRATTSQDIADGYVLAREYFKRNELRKAMDVYSELASMQSEVGRALQAQNLFKRLTPEGRVTSTLRNITKLRKSSGVDLQFDDSLIEAIYKAKNDDELLKANAELAKALWDQIPVSFAEKANAWRYLSMLGNPKTHIRNIMGNLLFQPARIMSDGVASGLEKAFSKRLKKLGGDGTGTHAVYNPLSKQAKEYKKVAEKEFDNIRTTIELSETKNFNRARYKDSPIFKTKIFNALERFNSQGFKKGDLLGLVKKDSKIIGLDKEDVAFMRFTFNDAFTQYCTAKGIDISTADRKILDEATEYAYDEALKATYRDANRLASAFNKVRGSLRVKESDDALMKAGKMFMGGAIDSIAPFVKTPMNILKRGALEYSPVGLIRGMGRILLSADKSADELLKSISMLSDGFTGSMVAGIGAYMAYKGMVNGSLGKWDNKKSYDEMLGKQDYAVTVGDKTYTLDWIAPMSMPFFVGVESSKLLEGGSPMDVVRGFSQMTEPIFEMSMLQGVENVFNTAFSEGEGVTQVAKNSMYNYASQFVPTLSGQAVRTRAKNRKIALSTADDPTIREIQKQFGKIAGKLPILNDVVNQDYVDQWGRTDTKLDGNDYAQSAIENFILPYYISDNKTTDVDGEILRLYDSLGEEYKESVIPKFTPTAYRQSLDDKEYIMTPSEFTQYKKTVGQAKFQGLEELFKTQKYKDASDDEKRKMITQVYEDANAKGKDEYLREVDKDYASAPEFYQIAKSTRDKYYNDSLGVSKQTWGKAWKAKHDISKAKEEETGHGTNAEEERYILLDNGIKTYKQAQSLLGKTASEELWDYAVEQHKQGVTYKELQREAKECPTYYNLSVEQKMKWSKDLGIDKETWGKAYQAKIDEDKKKKDKTGSGLNSEEEMILLKEHGIKTLEQARTIDGNIGKTFMIFDNDSENAWDEMVKAVKNGKTFEDATKEGYASAIKRNQAKEHVSNLGIPEKHQSSATTIMTRYDGKTVKQDVYDYYVRQAFYNNDNNPNPEKRNNTLDTNEIKASIEKADKKFGLTRAQKAYLFANMAPKNYKNPYA